MLIQGTPPKINSNKEKGQGTKVGSDVGGLGLFARVMGEKSTNFSDGGSGQSDQPLSEQSAGGDSSPITSNPLGLVGLRTVKDNNGGDFLNERQRQQAGAKWGHQLLDKLDEIKKLILDGKIPLEKMEQLAIKAGENKAKVKDPLLFEIMQDIQTRALVEVAKLKRAQKEQEKQSGLIKNNF